MKELIEEQDRNEALYQENCKLKEELKNIEDKGWADLGAAITKVLELEAKLREAITKILEHEAELRDLRLLLLRGKKGNELRKKENR
jgi:hypothetical protein